MSCSYKTLSNGPSGYVVTCRECNTYQLAFLSSLVSFSKEEYRHFCKQVQNVVTATDVSSPHDCKSVVLNTPGENMKILLTAKELRGLSRMLDEADTEEQATHLIKLFAG